MSPGVVNASHFGLGFCQQGIMTGCMAIPINHEIGERLAYVRRWPGNPPEGEGTYTPPAGSHKSSWSGISPVQSSR
jgi:hypothetical protein